MSSPSKPAKTQPVPLKALTGKQAGVLHPNDTVETAGDRMREHDAASWPVAEETKLVGAVDEKNPDWKLGGHSHDPKESQVGEIMNRNAIFCYEEDDCTQAEKLMAEHGLSYLPVVDHDMHIVGIFSRREIEEMASGNAERQRIARRAMEMAQRDGRVAFTDDDLAKATTELAEARSRAKAKKTG